MASEQTGDPAVIRPQEKEDDMALGSAAPGEADTERHVAAIRARLEKMLALWTRCGSSAADVIVNFDANRADDLDFIAHAPEDVAYLLAALAAAEQGRQEAGMCIGCHLHASGLPGICGDCWRKAQAAEQGLI